MDDWNRRQRRIGRAKTDPSIIRHGRNGYADYGCRCEVCVEDRKRYNRERLGSQPRREWTEEEITQALHVYATEGLRAAVRLGIASDTTISRWAKARGVQCFEPAPIHGRSRYQRYGCRCDVCVDAYREDMRRAKADLRSRMDKAPHGTRTAYVNWGCRCEPCRDAGSLQNRRTAIRRKAGLTQK